MTTGIIQLEILSWEKFNPRKDLKATTWLRLQNTIFEDPDFFEFDHSEICFWIYILSHASKKQTGTVSINISHAVKIGRFQKQTIQSSLHKLQSLQCVRVEQGIEHVDVTHTSRARNTTNERTVTNADVTYELDARPVPVRETHVTKKPSADSATAEIGKHASQVITRYCELWKKKYNTSPAFSGKWAGNAKTLVKDHGLARSLEFVEAFLEMKDTYFIQRRHSFEILLTSLAQITHYAGTGATITNTQLHQLDKTQANHNAGKEAAEYFMNKSKEQRS